MIHDFGAIIFSWIFLILLIILAKDFKEKGQAPSIRRIKNAGGIPTKELYQLFPGGPAKKAAKIAGLSKPQGCV